MEDSDPGRDFLVRMASVDDINAIVRHRCEMFRDMGQLRDDSYDALAEAMRAYLERAVPAGEYVAWLVSPESDPSRIIAGGGVQLRSILPRPDREGQLQASGKQALVVNVYTEEDWRRRGIGQLVMRTILAWCAEQNIPSIVLHASQIGRPLYERLGFKPTNEMYYPVGDPQETA